MTNSAQDFRPVPKISCKVVDDRQPWHLQADAFRQDQALQLLADRTNCFSHQDESDICIYIYVFFLDTIATREWSSCLLRAVLFVEGHLVSPTSDRLVTLYGQDWVKDHAHQRAEWTMHKRAGGSCSACPPMDTDRVTTKCISAGCTC